jgi:hypothetical protein
MANQRIPVQKIKKDLGEQFRFFVLRGFSIDLHNLKKGFYYLTGWTLLLLAFVTFSSTNIFIIEKAVFIAMTILAWAALMLFIPFVLIRKLRNLRRADRYVNSLMYLSYSMEFDDEKIIFFVNEEEVEFPWTHYNYYWEYKNSLYILCEKVPLDSIFLSANEIGEDNYELLKEKASTKLPKKPALL